MTIKVDTINSLRGPSLLGGREVIRHTTTIHFTNGNIISIDLHGSETPKEVIQALARAIGMVATITD